MNITENFISITNREAILVRGVNDIVEYDSEKIILDVCNSDMIICGENFNIKKIDVENKIAEITGRMSSITFADSNDNHSKSFLKSLFK